MKDHFDQFIITKEQRKFSPEVQKRLDHGCKNEINAKGTLIGKAMPCYNFGDTFKDVGSYTLKKNGIPFIVTSPDGEIFCNAILKMTAEFKCTVLSRPFCSPVLYTIPPYYIPQLLSHMHAAQVAECVFLCWTEESSTVFLVKFDETLWLNMYDKLMALYGEAPVKPKGKPDGIECTASLVKQFCLNNCTLLGEFPSVKAIPCSHPEAVISNLEDIQTEAFTSHVDLQHAQPSQSLLDIERHLNAALAVFTKANKITKPKASDLLVHMLCDLDRCKTSSNSVMAFPVNVALAPKSASIRSYRSLDKSVTEQVQAHGLRVLSKGYDGQFYNMAVIDGEGSNLTLLQEQKSLWRSILKTKKPALVSEIKNKLTESSAVSSELHILPEVAFPLSEKANEDYFKLDALLVIAIRCSSGLLTNGDVDSTLKDLRSKLCDETAIVTEVRVEGDSQDVTESGIYNIITLKNKTTKSYYSVLRMYITR